MEKKKHPNEILFGLAPLGSEGYLLCFHMEWLPYLQIIFFLPVWLKSDINLPTVKDQKWQQ